MVIYFATTNLNKFREVRAILKEYGIHIEHLNAKGVEIQSDSLEEIASYCAVQLLKYAEEVLVEDTGLFIKALKGFPGPYSSYVFKTIGNEGILKLMEGVENRRAYFKCVVAYCKRGLKPVLFTGVVNGFITHEKRGEGWGYDPIFTPEGYDKTYAEMGEMKNKLSHRRKAFESFARWYLSGGPR